MSLAELLPGTDYPLPYIPNATTAGQKHGGWRRASIQKEPCTVKILSRNVHRCFDKSDNVMTRFSGLIIFPSNNTYAI